MVGVGERPTIPQTLCRWEFEGGHGRSVGLKQIIVEFYILIKIKYVFQNSKVALSMV